jgi:hypothetical protein
VNTVKLGKFSFTDTGCVSAPDLDTLLCVEIAFVVSGTPAFGNHISHVVAVRTEKKVIRAHAPWIITFVTHEALPFWNRSVVQNPTHAVCLAG